MFPVTIGSPVCGEPTGITFIVSRHPKHSIWHSAATGEITIRSRLDANGKSANLPLTFSLHHLYPDFNNKRVLTIALEKLGKCSINRKLFRFHAKTMLIILIATVARKTIEKVIAVFFSFFLLIFMFTLP